MARKSKNMGLTWENIDAARKIDAEKRAQRNNYGRTAEGEIDGKSIKWDYTEGKEAK